jgi:predicted PhzF superfamily epimerase YddE/YHI9
VQRNTRILAAVLRRRRRLRRIRGDRGQCDRADDLFIGVVGAYPAGAAAFEVRAFFPKDGGLTEDPVTGSLNASVAQWLLGTGRATAPYVASQGTVLGRAGRVHVDQDRDGAIWVGGGTVTCVTGTVS